MKLTSYDDIPKFTRNAHYKVDISLSYLEEAVRKYVSDDGLNIDPDFQRAHVWTQRQQVAFVEYMLRGGTSGLDIYTNCPGWDRGKRGNFVLVDGKQRLTATLRYLRNEIPIFGSYRKEYTDRLPFHIGFRWWVNNLETRAEVLQWYLDFNTGGTPHTDDEIAKVRNMLDKEKAR